MVIPVIYSDKYVIELEVVKFRGKATTFIHAAVKDWNKSTYKELKEKWAEFRSHYREDIWAYPKTENTAKFAKMFGFKKRGEFMRHFV